MGEKWDKFKKLIAAPGNAIGEAAVKGGSQSSAYKPTVANNVSDALYLAGAKNISPQDVAAVEKISQTTFMTMDDSKTDKTIEQWRAEGKKVTVIEDPEIPGHVGALVVRDKNDNATVAVRGTLVKNGIQHPHDKARNMDTTMVPFGAHDAKVHQGFYSSALNLKLAIDKELAGANMVTYVGHSAGGSIANILAASSPAQNVRAITFEAPRTGDEKFANLLRKKTQGQLARFELDGDPVPGLPIRHATHVTTPIFRHFDNKDTILVGSQTDTSNPIPVASQLALIAGTMHNTHYAGAKQFEAYHNNKNSGWNVLVMQEENARKTDVNQIKLSGSSPAGTSMPVSVQPISVQPAEKTTKTRR